MVVANGVAEKEPVGFSIDLCHLSGKGLGTAIRRIRVDGRVFVLRTDGWRAKNFTTAGVHESWWVRLVSQDFHNPECADGRGVARAFWDVET